MPVVERLLEARRDDREFVDRPSARECDPESGEDFFNSVEEAFRQANVEIDTRSKASSYYIEAEEKGITIKLGWHLGTGVEPKKWMHCELILTGRGMTNELTIFSDDGQPWNSGRKLDSGDQHMADYRATDEMISQLTDLVRGLTKAGSFKQTEPFSHKTNLPQ